jgi:signal transduction histidine kinase
VHSLNIYSYILLFISVANFLLALYSLRFRKSPGTLVYCLLLIAISVYAFGYAFELSSDQLDTILFWLRVEYLGISFLPPLMIILAIHYTGRAYFLKSWIIALLVLFGLTTLFVQHTNFLGLFYKDFRLVREDQFTLANFTHGPWYWVHQIIVNLFLFISSLLYLIQVMEVSGINRIRSAIMLISCIVPWGIYLIYLTGNSPENFDLSPFSFSLVGFLAAVGVFRFKLLEYLPIALEHVFNSMTDGVIIIDKHNRLVSYNQSASRIYPQLSVRLKGEPLDFVIAGLPRLAELTDGFETDVEETLADGTTYFHVRAVTVKNDRNKSKGWAVIITDVTQRRLKENRLIQKEKQLKALNASKDKFLAIIGHDLRNSFHLMINMSDMMISNLEKDNKEGAIKKGKIIYDTSVTTYNLLQNLLEWALIQHKGMQFNPVDHDIVLVIEEEIKNLRTLYEQKELTITHDPDPPLWVKADTEMLKTILRNLISNAIKYSYPGTNIRISHTSAGGFVTISIRDEGTGMTSEEMEGIFGDENLSKKGTAAESGTGLGLRLCREFIQLHGGEIKVESIPEKGSTFTFTIPSVEVAGG